MTLAVFLSSGKRKQRHTTPREIGRSRDFNRVIDETLSIYRAEKTKELAVYLPHVTSVYNITVHRPIGVTFGREAQSSIDLFSLKPPGQPTLMLGENAEELNERLYENLRESNLLWEPNKDDKETFLIKTYMANHLKKETWFGCSKLTGQSPESSFCLGTALSRF